MILIQFACDIKPSAFDTLAFSVLFKTAYTSHKKSMFILSDKLEMDVVVYLLQYYISMTMTVN